MSAHFSALDCQQPLVVEGSGWRGRRESDSQAFCHANQVQALIQMEKHMGQVARQNHHHHLPPSPHSPSHTHISHHQELLDGSLELRYCTAVFKQAISRWVLPRLGGGIGGNRSTFTCFHGIQRRGDGKDCASLPPKEWGARWACLAIFLLALGLDEVCTGDAWNLPSERTGVGFFPRLVSPAVGAGALAQARFFFFAARIRAYRQRHARYCTVRTATTTKVFLSKLVAHRPVVTRGTNPNRWPLC